MRINSPKCSFFRVARWFDFTNFITEKKISLQQYVVLKNSQQYVVLKKIHGNMLCYTQKLVIHWYFKFWVFTFWNLSLKIKCRVALTKFFLTQIFLHVGQFFFYSRQVFNNRLHHCHTLSNKHCNVRALSRKVKCGCSVQRIWTNVNNLTARGVTRGAREPRGPQFPGRRKVLTMLQVLSPAADLFPKDLRFEHGGAKLVSCPRRHLTSLRPC